MAKTKLRMPVTERALFARISRKLAKDCIQFRRNRSPGDGVGRYFSVDSRNFVCNPSPWDLKQLEECGRDLGVLEPWEVLAD